MKKLFYICPHLSTGGMPQYVLKQVQTFGNQLDITVIEVNNISNDYTVQRSQFPKLIQLQGNESLLLKRIYERHPDIIHFQEIPERFLSRGTLTSIYSDKRSYNILITSHSSLTRRKDFTFFPDKIIAVNKWQKELFKKEMPEIDVDVWEYPIKKIKKTAFTVMAARQKLNFSIENERLNILNVGLFTPGKNQGELFEIARKNPQNTYHFVGNQAPNFEGYWKPLMDNKPSNCIVWGERRDMDLFYQACDEMYFTSKFELNPLCVKEALSYEMPVKMYKLETYGDDYDNNPLVTYIKPTK